MSPEQTVAHLDLQWSKWYRTWESQGKGAAIKPIIPIGDGYNTHPGSEITAFVDALKSDTNPPTLAGRYYGVSFFSAQAHSISHWDAIASATIGTTSTLVPDMIADNLHASFEASSNWAVGTSAADKYGSDYRFRPTSAVSDAATWNMTVPQSGTWKVYAWWSQGTNRSATAPFIIPGLPTVSVNQQTDGGQWNLLGTTSLTAGIRPVRLSCWTTTGFVVVADAIKLSQH